VKCLEGARSGAGGCPLRLGTRGDGAGGAGASAYLTKSFNVRTLLQTVDETLGDGAGLAPLA
jgi:hypothetical protein